jgi:hypothetical protein
MRSLVAAGVALALFVLDIGQRIWWRLRRRAPPRGDPVGGQELEAAPRPIRLASLQGPSTKGFDAQQGDRRAHVESLKRRVR